MDGTALRTFGGTVWLDAELERFSIKAPSWNEAVAHLNERYGKHCPFVLTDGEAATRAP